MREKKHVASRHHAGPLPGVGLLLCFYSFLHLHGALVLPSSVFADHMVLQRDVEHPVWGVARPGALIDVFFAGQHKQTTVDADGNWIVRLDALEASAVPRALVVNGDGRVVIHDVLVGDVWLCSGQSNMRWPLASCDDQGDLSSVSLMSMLRLCNRVPLASTGPVVVSEDQLHHWRAGRYYEGTWAKATAETAATFSGVAWFFGQTLVKRLGVPVGLVLDAVGGAPAESYVRRDALLADERLRPLAAAWFESAHAHGFCRERAAKQLGHMMQARHRPAHPFEPGVLWQASTSDWTRFPIRGVIWYQGESNAPLDGVEFDDDPAFQKHLFHTLIRDWREQFQQPLLPFIYVQLPCMDRPWQAFRQMQWETLREIPQVGMAVILEHGDPKDVHPRAKRPVGERLARWAFHTVYGLRDEARSGPIVRVARRVPGAVEVYFDEADGVLLEPPGALLAGFEWAAAERHFVQGSARVAGPQHVRIDGVSADDVCFVRFGWAPCPNSLLFNRERMPASPFEIEVLP